MTLRNRVPRLWMCQPSCSRVHRPRAAPAPGAGPTPATGVISTPATGVISTPATGVISAPATGANPALETRVKTESAGGANSAPAASVTGRDIFGHAEAEVQYLGAVPRNRQQGENLTYYLFEKKNYYSNISLIKSVMLPKLINFLHSPALIFVTLPHYFPSRIIFRHPPALFFVTLTLPHYFPSRIIFRHPPALFFVTLPQNCYPYYLPNLTTLMCAFFSIKLS